MGLIGYVEFFSMLMKLDQTVLISDENITVMDTKFTDVPVCLYLPKKKSESQRRAVIFIHGGAFVMGSCSKYILYKQMYMCVCVCCILCRYIFKYICIYNWQNFISMLFVFVTMCMYLRDFTNHSLDIFFTNFLENKYIRFYFFEKLYQIKLHWRCKIGNSIINLKT